MAAVCSASAVQFRQNGWNFASVAATTTSTTTAFTLFSLLAGTSAYIYNGDIAEVLVYNAALSGTNLTSVENYLLTKYALPAAPSPSTPLVVVEGDSISQGVNTTLNSQEYPEVAYQGAHGAAPYNYRNIAVSGSQISDLTNRASQVDALYSPLRAKNILYVWVGTNDMAHGQFHVYADLQQPRYLLRGAANCRLEGDRPHDDSPRHLLRHEPTVLQQPDTRQLADLCRRPG